MASQPRRGRPAGLLLNPAAGRFFLGDRAQSWLAKEADISPAQMSGMFAGSKGATEDVAHRVAEALEVPVAILFPELAEFTTTIRHFTAPKVEGAAA